MSTISDAIVRVPKNRCANCLSLVAVWFEQKVEACSDQCVSTDGLMTRNSRPQPSPTLHSDLWDEHIPTCDVKSTVVDSLANANATDAAAAFGLAAGGVKQTENVTRIQTSFSFQDICAELRSEEKNTRRKRWGRRRA